MTTILVGRYTTANMANTLAALFIVSIRHRNRIVANSNWFTV